MKKYIKQLIKKYLCSIIKEILEQHLINSAIQSPLANCYKTLKENDNSHSSEWQDLK
jgi:hypothetical protein